MPVTAAAPNVNRSTRQSGVIFSPIWIGSGGWNLAISPASQ